MKRAKKIPYYAFILLPAKRKRAASTTPYKRRILWHCSRKYTSLTDLACLYGNKEYLAVIVKLRGRANAQLNNNN